MEARRQQVAGYLLLYSALMTIFAVINLNLFDDTPSGQFTVGPYPAAVGLAASSALFLMAITGVAVSAAEYVYNVGSPMVTMIALAIEFVCGWFFFIALPVTSSAISAQNAATSTEKASIMMGLLSAMGMGIPLLGAKFFFNLMLYRAQKPGEAIAIYTSGYYSSRAAFYSFLVLLKGVGEVVLSGISVGMTPAVQPPLAIFDTSIGIADGVLTILVALYGLTISSFGIKGQSKMFGAVSFLSWLLQICLMDLAQLSKTPPMPHPFPADVVGAVQITLLTGMMLMPAYLVEQMDRAAGPTETEIPAKVEV